MKLLMEKILRLKGRVHTPKQDKKQIWLFHWLSRVVKLTVYRVKTVFEIKCLVSNITLAVSQVGQK